MMKKSICISFLCMSLALGIFVFVWNEADKQKEEIVMTEEILVGKPEAAHGVTLEIASQLKKHLLWDTVYTIGSKTGAESDFTFSSQKVVWWQAGEDDANIHFLYDAEFEQTGQAGIEIWDDTPWSRIVQAAAERTKPGQQYNGIFRLADYYEYYPTDLEFENCSVTYEDVSSDVQAFLTRLFRIQTANEQMEMTVEKNPAGELVSFKGRILPPERMEITDTAAFGKTGCYYSFGCGTDREQNSGIFYIPFQERDGTLFVHLTQMQNICRLPKKAIPLGMLLEDDETCLYLVIKLEDDFYLQIYTLDEDTPVLTGQIHLQQKHLPSASTHFSQMTAKLGGVLLTWSDNSFSFITREDGKYRLWCEGRFPTTTHPDANADPFATETECVFDGERLVLAAFEDWNSLNVLVTVYNVRGEQYYGRYRHSGEVEPEISLARFSGTQTKKELVLSMP